MATNFPTSQDSFTNPSSGSSLSSPSHSQQHSDVNDAVEALEAKVGVDDSTVSSSLDYRVAALEQTSGRRNLLYNGAMQVNQRGETASSLGTTSGGYYTADRWLWRNSGNMGTWTNTTEVDAPDGFEKSFKTTCVTADASPASGDLLAVQQRIEGADLQHLKWGTSNAEQVTLSFWVKSNVTGTYAVPLEQPISGGGFKYATLEYTINSSATWEHKVLTFPANTVATMLNTTGIGLTVWFLLDAHSFYTGGSPQSTWGDFQTSGSFGGGQVNLASTVGNYWQVTGVQLEVGDKATPFEWRPYGEELALCERYHQVGSVVPQTAGNSGNYFQTTGSNNFGAINTVAFRTRMRTVPTMGWNFTSTDNAQVTQYYVNQDSCGIRVIANNTGFLYCSYYASFAASAEL